MSRGQEALSNPLATRSTSASGAPGLGASIGSSPIARGALILGLIVATALPFVVSGSDLRLLTTVWMFAALAQCWNFIGGYVGYAAFGNVVFFGLGGYITAVVMQTGAPFAIGLLAAAVLAALFAAAIGGLVLRLRGQYFAIATLGVAEATREVILNLDALGGSTGLSLPIARDFNLFYYLLLGLVVVLAALTWWIEHARAGYAFVAIRENEESAAALGINPLRYKILAYCLGAFFTGIVGGVYAYWTTFIDPATVFSSSYSVEIIAVCLIGGAGSILGPIIGAIVFEYLAGQIWANFISWHDTILGLMVVVFVLFLPRGLMSLTTIVGRRRRATRTPT